VASAAWLAAFAALTVRRRSATPPVGKPTLDLPPAPEPPAVVNLLTHGFRVTPDAVPATLLDLAARGVVALEHRGPDAFVCRLGAVPDSLTPYEQRVVSLLRDRMSGGVVPPEALTSGPEREAQGWRKAFDREVVADARQRGLCRPIADGKLAFGLFVGALVPGVVWGRVSGHSSGVAGVVFVAGAALVVAVSRRAQRETPAGLAAATRWLGVRAALREDEVFATLPPITVGLWKRYLAYGAALGVAPGAVRPIQMGAESDSHAWSSYGGRWRAVRIEYPTVFPLGWGLRPVLALLVGAAVAVASGFVLFAVAGPLANANLAVAAPFFVPPAIGAVAAVIVVGRALADLAGSPVTVHGEILRLRILGDKNKRNFVAVDDGSSARIKAFVVELSLYRLLEQGEIVEVVATRHLRHVQAISRVASQR
jgi:Predicted membrane protein (DUF2207)